MEEGLKLFLLLVVPVMSVIYAIVGWLNYRENPLYWRAMLRLLSPGQIRLSMLSPEIKEGTTMLVVRDIKKVKRKIIGKKTVIVCDIYVMKNKKPVLSLQDAEYSVGGFYRNTDPCPVYFDETTCVGDSTKKS